MRRLLRAFGSALRIVGTFSLGAATLGAQQQPDSVRADSVRADSVRARPAQRLAPQVITGTRLSGSADERTPAQVDVLALENATPGPAAAAEALRRLPGVSAFDDQGSRAQPSLDVRGFTLSPVVGVPQGVSVFLDGVRINEPDAQEVHFDLIPMDAVAEAELVRGPAALFGKNTLAGALALTTKRGTGSPVLDASADGGAFGYRAGRVAAGGVARGVDGFLMARASDEDGYREGTPARTRLAFGTVGRRGERGDVALSLLLARDRIGQAGSLPESWLAVNRRANFTVGDFFAPDLAHVALRGERAVGGEARLRGNLFSRRNATEQFNVNVGNPSTRAFVVSRSRGGAAELALPTRIGPLPLGVTVGAEYARSDIAYRIFQEPTAAAPAVDADCAAAASGETRQLCENARVDQDDAALYVQGVLGVGERLSFTAAARYDYVRVPFRDLSTPANSGTSRFDRVSPRLGANLRLSDDVRGYVVVSGGFRAPAALELACADETAPCPLPFSLGDDPPLAPVTLRNYEAGFDWEAARRFELEGSVYRADVHDEIVFLAATTAAGYFQNVRRTRRQGLELTARLSLPLGVRAFGSYTLTDATYRTTVKPASALALADSARPGDRFPLSPAHRGTAGVGLTHVVNRSTVLDAELSGRFVSSQFLRGDEANDTAPLGGYGVGDLRLSLEQTWWALRVQVSNLFDRRYESFGIYGENPLGPYPGSLGGSDPPAVERFLTPGYPRALTVGVRLGR